MKYIASCSFGKDSIAQILVAKTFNEPLDEIVYSEVMFTNEISGEFPEHRDFIYNVAIPKFENVLGIKTTVVRSDKTMWDIFHTKRTKGINEGKLRGFPIPGFCDINRDLKIPPIRQYLKDQGEIVQYVGLASDEIERLERIKGTNKISLLEKYRIDEKTCIDICKEAGLLSPIYDFARRNGCFFCPNASMKEYFYIYKYHKDLWRMLKKLQSTPNTSRRCFTRNMTVYDLEKKFKKGIQL